MVIELFPTISRFRGSQNPHPPPQNFTLMHSGCGVEIFKIQSVCILSENYIWFERCNQMPNLTDSFYHGMYFSAMYHQLHAKCHRVRKSREKFMIQKKIYIFFFLLCFSVLIDCFHFSTCSV